MRCPHCGKIIKDEELLEKIDQRKLLRKAGSIGGQRARGEKKAQPPEVARRAAQIRWSRRKKENSQ